MSVKDDGEQITFPASWSGFCWTCNETWAEGDELAYHSNGKVVHAACDDMQPISFMHSFDEVDTRIQDELAKQLRAKGYGVAIFENGEISVADRDRDGGTHFMSYRQLQRAMREGDF